MKTRHSRKGQWMNKQELICIKHYTPEDYPRYDNYDAIDVCPYNEIPYDYEGEMGVPITFLDKLNPEQFEILNANDYRRNEQVPIKLHGLIKDKESFQTQRNTYYFDLQYI